MIGKLACIESKDAGRLPISNAPCATPAPRARMDKAMSKGENAMRLGLLLRYKGDGGLRMDLVHEAERLGFESVWSSEAYGSDAVSPAAWVLAQTKRIKAGTGIMQMPARTPACAAMTAIALQAMSGNRFIMGIGPSGPQVVEGWHGVPYGKPLMRTKEYIAIVRQIFAREAPLQFKGEHYQIPYTGPGASGLGKPLKSIAKPNPDLKIYTAAIAPAGLRTAGEVADGVLPIFINPEKPDEVANHVLDGMAAAGKAALAGELRHCAVCARGDGAGFAEVP